LHGDALQRRKKGKRLLRKMYLMVRKRPLQKAKKEATMTNNSAFISSTLKANRRRSPSRELSDHFLLSVDDIILIILTLINLVND